MLCQLKALLDACTLAAHAVLLLRTQLKSAQVLSAEGIQCSVSISALLKSHACHLPASYVLQLADNSVMVSSKDGQTVVQVASYDMAIVDNSIVARQVSDSY
jgi:hypothetical protein